MSSNNNNSEINGLIFVMAMAAAAAIALAAVIYVVLAAITFALSIFCVFALWKPRKLGKEIVTPKEARWFLFRGIIGFYAFPLLVALLANAMRWQIDGDLSIHIMIAGYILGSLGGEFVLAKLHEGEDDEEPAKTEINVVVPWQRRQDAPPKPFEYARWDDEEERKP